MMAEEMSRENKVEFTISPYLVPLENSSLP
jgi:hypothetical protein